MASFSPLPEVAEELQLQKKEKGRADAKAGDAPLEPIEQDLASRPKSESQAPLMKTLPLNMMDVDAFLKARKTSRADLDPKSVLSNPMRDDRERPEKFEEDEFSSEHSGAGECFGKLLVIFFILAVLFICISSNSLALVAFRDYARTPVAIGQLFLLLALPSAVTFISSFCTKLVREGKIASNERQLSSPALAFLGILEAGVSATAECIFIFYILPTAQGSVILVLLAINWNLGPLILLLRESFTSGPQSYTPLGVVVSPFIMRIIVGVASVCTLIALIFCMVTSKLWWEVPLLAAVSAFSHWENFFPDTPLAVQRSLSLKRFSLSSTREFFRVVWIVLLFMLFSWQKYDIGPGTFFRAIGDTHNSATERAFYVHIATAFVGFLAAWLGNLVFYSRLGVGLPLLLSTPVCVVLHEALLVKSSHFFYGIAFSSDALDGTAKHLVPAAVSLGVLGACGGLYYLFQNRSFPLIVLLAERDFFSRPGYEGLLHHSLTLNSLRPIRWRAPAKSKWPAADPFRHKTFVLATMWHEGEEEMKYVVESLVGLSKEIRPNSGEEYETHIVFDDAIKNNDANTYVQSLFRVFRDADLFIEDPVETWYGYLVVVRMPGQMPLNVHLKNVLHVKQKKRWSQNLAIEVILTSMAAEPLERFDQTYLLLLDGDTRFKKKDVDILRGRIVEEPDRIGAVCGRIIPDVAPENTNPIVWYQLFEYAASHWLQKASEHVFGSVFCCPGCFTLVRFSALMRRAGNPRWSDWEDTPLAVYNKEAESAMDVLMLEQGEDRMLSTQLVRNGWLLQYCSDAQAVTFCPDSFDGFFTQRRRWNTSTVANIYYLLAEASTILSRNGAISLPYIISTMISLFVMLIGPAMIIVITVGGISYGLRVSNVAAAIIGILIPGIYVMICVIFHIDMSDPNPKKKIRKFEIQTGAALVLTAVYVVIMGVVLIGIGVQFVAAIVTSDWTPDIIYVIMVFAIYGIAAVIHGEASMLLHLPIYLLLTPTMSLLLPIFCVMNLHDMSWGTRDSATKDSVVVKEDLGFFKFGWRNFKELMCRAPGNMELTPAARWLAEINLSEYIASFAAHGYDTLESLASMKEEHLEQLNIKLGHRVQLRNAVAKLASSFAPNLNKPVPQKSLLKQAELRTARKRKEQELTAVFKLVHNHKYRDFLKRLHDSLKFSTVDTVRQKTELAELQKKAGISLITVTFIVLAVTIVFGVNFEASETHWGFLRVNPRRIPGYVIVFFYALLMLVQFFGMLFYRFGIFLYTISRWRLNCNTPVFVGEEISTSASGKLVMSQSQLITPSTSGNSINAISHV